MWEHTMSARIPNAVKPGNLKIRGHMIACKPKLVDSEIRP